MTAVAGHGQVRSGERILRLLMLFDCELGRAEACDAVALFASALCRSIGELPVMEIFMASAALVEFQPRERLPRLMALLAEQIGVLPSQREFGAAVIEIDPIGCPPAFGIVTTGAISAELAGVSVAVTVGAELKREPGELRV